MDKCRYLGPFTKDQIPFRQGVYFCSPWPNALGGGYAYWDGKSWGRFRNWGGFYFEGKNDWYWFGLTKEQSNYPSYVVL